MSPRLSLAPAFALSLSVALLAPGTPASAAKDAELKPVLATPGKVLAEDTFAAAELPKSFTANKGDAAIKDGTLALAFKASDNHAAVLTLVTPNHDSIIKFSFKMDDAEKGFALSYNSGGGHLFRVLVGGQGVNVIKDAEKEKGAKKPKGKAKAASAPVKTAAAPKSEGKAKGRSANSIAKAEGAISAGEWHTMLVEVKGTKVCVQTDTGLKAEGEHAELDVDKTGYRFVTSASISLDDVKAWSVE